MIQRCFFLLILLNSVFCTAQQPTQQPSRLILNLTEDPTSSIAITWRTDTEIKNPSVLFLEETDELKIEKKATTYPAKTEILTLDNGRTVYHHSAILTQLRPSTRYVYRAGCESGWSEWNTFRTASAQSQPFTFVFIGDPQFGFRDYLPRLYRKALTTAPDAAFWLYIGDLIDEGEKDEQWNDWFFSLDFTPRLIPSVMAPGNHEYTDIRHRTDKRQTITPLWRLHFTLPENGPSGLQETAYTFDYQGVRFIMLNGQEQLAAQAQWMDSLLSNNPRRWTVAAVHQPAYSMGARRDDKRIREAFMPIFDKHSVDLVLTGHDHVYSRSYKLRNGRIVDDSQSGTVYIVSVSGTKQYSLNLNHASLMAKYAEKVMLFHVFSVDHQRLKMTAYTASGQVFDSFELVKP